MNPRKGLVLDANILMRAVLGRRVRELLEMYEDAASGQSLCLSNSAALSLNNSSIINARARIPHTKDRRVPTPGTVMATFYSLGDRLPVNVDVLYLLNVPLLKLLRKG